jgi:hypothetical protein
MTLTRTLKGSPLTVLFAMLLLRRPLGVTELETITGYDRKTVRKGLKTLQGLMLVTQTQRFFGWQLTDRGYQLPLIGLEALSLPDSSEAEILPLDPRSSSYLNSISIDQYHMSLNGANQQQLPLPNEGEFLPLVNLLTDRCGSPPSNAKKAITVALARDSPLNIEVQILRWLAYCQSKRGRTIQNPGIFIPTRIEQGISAPPDFEPTGQIGEEIKRLTANCTFCDNQATDFINPAQPLCEACARKIYPSSEEQDQ